MPTQEQRTQSSAQRLVVMRSSSSSESLPESKPLYPHQAKAAAFLAVKGRALLGDEMGIGKSRSALEAIKLLDELDAQAGEAYTRVEPILIIAPKVALSVWVDEVRKWLGESVAIFPQPLMADKDGRLPRFIATNWEQLPKLLKIRATWALTIVDESHLVRNRKTERFKNLKRIHSQRFFALSGSPVVNHVDDLWTTLNIIDHKKFSSYWRFYGTHVLEAPDEDTGWIKPVGIRNPQALRAALAPYMLRRRKADVLEGLPEKIRQAIHIEMTDEQKRLYEALARDLIAQLDMGSGADLSYGYETSARLADPFGDEDPFSDDAADLDSGNDEDESGDAGPDYIMASSELSLITRLRQTLVTPALYGGQHSSATLEALTEYARADFDAKTPIIVFCPFAEAIPYIHQALNEAGADSVHIMRGGQSPSERMQQLKAFQAEDDPKASPRRALVCSLKLGTSFTATAAKVAYFVGSGWTAVENTQAEDRIHRIGQDRGVLIRYFVNTGTIDEHIMDIVEKKTTWAALAMSDPLSTFFPKQ